jgi:hypothetical protein
MRKAVLFWILIVALSLGLGASIYLCDGWVRFAILTGIVIVLAITCAAADYAIRDGYDSDPKKTKILYISTAIVATWPLLACVMIDYSNLDAVAATTITLIGISIRRSLENG